MFDYPQSPDVISKILSHNDTGQSGGHQAGILIPRTHEILSFFPVLDHSTKNPRVHLEFIDLIGRAWIFAFIYYNNAYFGGTRNEYRLTRMTEYFRLNDLVAGDELILSRDTGGERSIDFRRANNEPLVQDGILRLGNNWKVISTNSRRQL